MSKNSISLYSPDGERKYLNQKERLRFLEASEEQPTTIKLFCQLLCYTGGRISEIYNLTARNIDLTNETVVIESLKKRQKGVFREIPLPDFLLEELRNYIKNSAIKTDMSLWSLSLRTYSRKIKKTMHAAHITGIRSCAKGLRHGFAVYAVTKVPITMVKKWLGHAKLETTEIYLNIVGDEEREIAKRLW